MRKNEELQRKWQNVLWYVGCIIVVLCTVVWYRVISYDTEDIVVTAITSDSKVSVEISGDYKTNDSWKTTMPVSEDPEDFIALTGTTCQASILNTKKHNIKDWKLRININ